MQVNKFEIQPNEVNAGVKSATTFHCIIENVNSARFYKQHNSLHALNKWQKALYIKGDKLDGNRFVYLMNLMKRNTERTKKKSQAKWLH